MISPIKLIAIIILALSTSNWVFGQEELSKVVNVTLPSNKKKLNKIELSTTSKQRFEKVPFTLPNDKIFQVDNMILSVRDLGRKHGSNRSLEDFKRELMGVYSLNPERIKTNKIITIGNIKVLLVEILNDKEGSFHFYTDYKNDKNFTGQLNFAKADEEDAKSYIETILKSLKFKE